MNRDCTLCRFLRVLLLGGAGALVGAWLGPKLGASEQALIMPATLGALVALALGVAFVRR